MNRLPPRFWEGVLQGAIIIWLLLITQAVVQKAPDGMYKPDTTCREEITLRKVPC